jgi:hypothetical protein
LSPHLRDSVKKIKNSIHFLGIKRFARKDPMSRCPGFPVPGRWPGRPGDRGGGRHPARRAAINIPAHHYLFSGRGYHFANAFSTAARPGG